MFPVHSHCNESPFYNVDDSTWNKSSSYVHRYYFQLYDLKNEFNHESIKYKVI